MCFQCHVMLLTSCLYLCLININQQNITDIVVFNIFVFHFYSEVKNDLHVAFKYLSILIVIIYLF
jgi:hypothetical protein